MVGKPLPLVPMNTARHAEIIATAAKPRRHGRIEQDLGLPAKMIDRDGNSSVADRGGSRGGE